MAGCFEFGCRYKAALEQMLAEQRQGMTAQGQAEAAVIGNQVFGFAGHGQFGFRLADGCALEKIALNLCHCFFHAGCPGGLSAVTGQTLQGIGGGKLIEIAALQPGTRRQIGYIQK